MIAIARGAKQGVAVFANARRKGCGFLWGRKSEANKEKREQERWEREAEKAKEQAELDFILEYVDKEITARANQIDNMVLEKSEVPIASVAALLQKMNIHWGRLEANTENSVFASKIKEIVSIIQKYTFLIEPSYPLAPVIVSYMITLLESPASLLKYALTSDKGYQNILKLMAQISKDLEEIIKIPHKG